VTWWTNIRFEKVFSETLPVAESIWLRAAFLGGLEVASDRLLKLIDKGNGRTGSQSHEFYQKQALWCIRI
jgi:hypothetical protein